MLQYHTAGESHGKALLALIEGFPAGVKLSAERIDAELRRRQGGYGRGARQQIETDHAEIISGLWRGATIGSPIAILIANRDATLDELEELSAPRPGHADLAGAMKHLGTMRGSMERSSARETAARVAAGAVARHLLDALGIEVFAYVTLLGPLDIQPPPGTFDQQRVARDASIIYSLNPDQDAEARALIDQARQSGDTLGGVIECRVCGVPFGLGSCGQWDRRLDGRLAQAAMSIPGVKGVEIGMGFESARLPGSAVHDPIHYDAAQADSPSLGFVRASNNAGGIEGGMSNAQPIVIRAACKPPPSLDAPLDSVDLKTLQSATATRQRSDVCFVPAASCVLENAVAFEIARAVVEKFGGDSLAEITARQRLFNELARETMPK